MTAQLTVTIAGRVHRVACDEGEEARLGDLAERHLKLAIRLFRAKRDVAICHPFGPCAEASGCDSIRRPPI
ncbi:MAG: hypothetical protein DLM68_09150 [Hyphomicrobiales bacterium]|nr:MAG: hypothetical protein DLM68_09150 [Hyphomicrobiales bacterium]